MSKLDKWIDNKIVQNLFVWIFILLIFMIIIQAENRLIVALFFIAFIMPLTYIQNLKILPYFFKKKIQFGVFLSLLNISFFTFLGVFFLSDFFERFELRMLPNIFGGVILTLVFGTATKLAKDSFVRRQQEKEAELKLLKAQLNPHFLFNTLNNLYGLSVIKSDKLPDLMLKLSDLLRYSLYETAAVLVPMEKEITYLKNYISLEKIRLEDKTDINFKASGNFSNLKIAPMLFIVFVENAFKHLGNLENEQSKVLVNISEENDKIKFTCKNTIDIIDEQHHNLEKGKSGIGLVNAKKRLELLYTDKYQLKIDKTDDLYCVNLTLEV
ncbi:sensor histidine kinase [Polaribacter porphyrae]|uniref:Signal transduction histidine kinase internal region domain-containing protein n=1 Tax=Polaribacter porphyrae TaxID=1137780 RepID=A0A2S7WR71_9FLAO|nr:histidine kinase [Polaribacter porphyrae]PQJ80118.1 hypothetical protein BTO18_13450 [Polaribacter porphyrae]